MIAFDFETFLIIEGDLAPPIVCMSLCDGGEGVLFDRHSMVAPMERVLAPGVVAIGQNIAYDFGCWLAEHPEDFERVWGKYERGEVYDIGIAATLDAIAEGRLVEGDLFMKHSRRKIQKGRYSLELLVEEWCGRTNAKENDDFRLRYGELYDVPVRDWPLAAVQYPKDDAKNTFDVAKAQIEGDCKNIHLVAFQTWVAFCLHLGATWGLRTDGARVEAFASNVESQLKTLKEELWKLGLYRMDGPKSKPEKQKLVKNTAFVKELVKKAYGDQYPRTESGDVGADRMTLKESGDPLLKKLAGVSSLDKQISYVPSLRAAARHPLNVRPNVLLSTGRTSYDGIVQLIPRKGGLRQCFKASEGRALISVDYAAVELSTLAQVLRWMGIESRLLDAINKKLDAHCLLGCKLNSTKYEDFVALRKAGDPPTVGLRQAGKAANFGFPGMMGAPKFVLAKQREGDSVCEWFYRDGKCGERRTMSWKGRAIDRPLCVRCIQQAEHLRHYYAYEAWVEMPEYWSRISEALKGSDTMQQFGSKMIRGGLTGPSAANNLFQGLAAWGAKHAVIALTREMYTGRTPEGKESPLGGSRLALFAHDETIIDTPLDLIHEAGFRQAEIMVQEMKRVACPDVHVEAEPAAMIYWDKDAAKVLDENGRLQVWQPKQKEAA